MEKPLIFHIQKYSIHDGVGIRTTVFFKGCPLSCLWCHNPESQSFHKELLFYADRCVACGACVAACPHGAAAVDGVDRALCQTCESCLCACPRGARESAGKYYELPALIRELEKDRMFYEQSGGGITLSGGEVLAQDMDYIEALAQRLHQKGYSVNIDTCGYIPYDHIRRVLPYTDTFLYDIKLLEASTHRAYTGVDNALILENLRRLSADGGRIHLRLPLIHGVNADEAYIQGITRFLKDHAIHPCQISLLPYHDTGSGKYARLGRPHEKNRFTSPAKDFLQQSAAHFQANGFQNIQIGG